MCPSRRPVLKGRGHGKGVHCRPVCGARLSLRLKHSGKGNFLTGEEVGFGRRYVEPFGWRRDRRGSDRHRPHPRADCRGGSRESTGRPKPTTPQMTGPSVKGVIERRSARDVDGPSGGPCGDGSEKYTLRVPVVGGPGPEGRFESTDEKGLGGLAGFISSDVSTGVVPRRRVGARESKTSPSPTAVREVECPLSCPVSVSGLPWTRPPRRRKSRLVGVRDVSGTPGPGGLRRAESSDRVAPPCRTSSVLGQGSCARGGEGRYGKPRAQRTHPRPGSGPRTVRGVVTVA